MGLGYFGWLDAIFDDKQLRDIAKDRYYSPREIAICIAKHSKNRSGYECFPSAATIAELIGCSAKTIERCRKELIDLGWFKIVGRNGGDNRRSLVLDISLPAEVE